MKNYEIPEQPDYTEEIRMLESTDLAHANIFNVVYQRIISNVAFLKRHYVDKDNLGSQKPEIAEIPQIRENINKGDSLGTIIAKVIRWISDLKSVAFSGSYDDLRNKPASLKNPNALTINGKLYDGSTAQDVGPIGLAYGGTGAATAEEARKALGLGTAAVNGVANNDTTTAAGYAADARIVKTHGDEIDRLNSDLGGVRFGVDTSGNYGYYKAGADTVTPFRNAAIIFTGSPVSMKNYTNQWEKLTAADFIVGVTSYSAVAYHPGAEIKLSSTSASANVTKSYNASTGQLTFTAPSGSTGITGGRVGCDAYGLFAVYLGTVGGR